MDDKRKEIAKAKFIVGESIQAIADDLGVSRRTIERWAAENDDEWRKLKDKNGQTNVIQLQPKPKVQSPKPAEFRRHNTSELEDIEVIESAIADIHASLPGAELGKGSMATALVKLIELKRKLKPETVADLVERVIELGIGPEEFLTELNNAWQRKRA
ncbi:MAG: helix-turn-helix domain-containing protein [Nostoc sp.]|uniref:helix-turn-helix domain-containing protein n=1 Tax=Nostoc sp. TaxID=1180 RepID=UPI002FEFBDD5